MLLCCGFGCCFAFDVPPVTAPSIGVCVGPWLAPVWCEARQDAEASSVRPGMACRWTPTQARSAGHPSSALLLLAMEGRSSRVAALFGYFLALLPKSNSPVGEKPRLDSAKAAQRVTPLDSGFRRNDEIEESALAPRYTRCAGTRGERSEWNVEWKAPLTSLKGLPAVAGPLPTFVGRGR